jgi:hypothetical protein
MNKMRDYLFLLMALLLTSSSVFADSENTRLNLYAIEGKVNVDHNSAQGFGIILDSEEVKAKLEYTPDLLKAATVFKFNPLHENMYHKVGISYVKQKLYAPDDSSARVAQYSGAFATGYSIRNDIYSEIGVSRTQLRGGNIGNNYLIKDERTDRLYIELAKRTETDIGTLDVTVNTGKVFHQYSSNKAFSGLGIDLYPTSNSKLGYKYQDKGRYRTSQYSAQYKYLFAKYADNLTYGTYQVSVGVSIAFKNLFDISSYSTPKNIVPHLSEPHRFEDIAFGDNLFIQTATSIEEKTTAAPTLPLPIVSDASFSRFYAGGTLSISNPASVFTNIQTGAVWSLDAGSHAGFSINSVTSALTFSDNITDRTVTVIIRVTNPDGGTDAGTLTIFLFGP